MTEKVTKLFAVNTLANGNVAVAANLRQLADAIESDKRGDVRHAIVVLSSDVVSNVTIGGPINWAEMVGLLTLAIHKTSCDACEGGS